jgi:hypothetical protein
MFTVPQGGKRPRHGLKSKIIYCAIVKFMPSIREQMATIAKK